MRPCCNELKGLEAMNSMDIDAANVFEQSFLMSVWFLAGEHSFSSLSKRAGFEERI